MVSFYTSQILVWLANIIMAGINKMNKIIMVYTVLFYLFILFIPARIIFTIHFIPSKPELIIMKTRPKSQSRGRPGILPLRLRDYTWMVSTIEFDNGQNLVENDFDSLIPYMAHFLQGTSEGLNVPLRMLYTLSRYSQDNTPVWCCSSGAEMLPDA